MYRLFSLLTLLVFFTACSSDSPANTSGSSDNSESTSPNEDNGGINITYENDQGEKESVNIDLDNIDIDVDKAKEGLADMLEQVSDNLRSEDGERSSGGEAMNYQDLKDILPTRLLGLERTNHTGEQGGAFGMSVSQAEATYKEDNQRLAVVVVDMGGAGLGKMGMSAFTNVTVQREGDFGYERTTEIEGHKAFEKWDADSQNGELVWAYKERYLITLSGRGLDEDDLRKALGRIDYDELD